MSTKTHWENAWKSADPGAKSWFQDEAVRSLEMIEDAAIAHDEAIIDVGGGASVLVDALLQRGFANLSVLDISQAALTCAQQRLDDRGLGDQGAAVRWLCADATDWQPAHPFRLWHDRAVFHFLTDAEDRAHYLAIAEKAIVPGGQLIMATFAEDGPQKCSGLPVQRYNAAMLAAAMGAGFHLVEEDREEHLTPGGIVQKFQYCRFVRL